MFDLENGAKLKNIKVLNANDLIASEFYGSNLGHFKDLMSMPEDLNICTTMFEVDMWH